MCWKFLSSQHNFKAYFGMNMVLLDNFSQGLQEFFEEVEFEKIESDVDHYQDIVHEIKIRMEKIYNDIEITSIG